ncbi:MAG: peptidyl-prolyl cis-trans isomerase [Gammaproteobacteria bacterium]|nr:peptidyl-prolyl cis-trans isomerase [Gammaproteobacteria bacterium]
MKRIKQIVLAALCWMTTNYAGAVPVPAGLPSDTLALVVDKPITFSQLNTQLNSSAVVGLSTPALGSSQRGTVLLTLLDKAISLNLMYLDAIKQGRHQELDYQRELKTFSAGLLAGLYRKHYLRQGLEVSEQEIQDYFNKHFFTDSGLTERLRAVIEAKLRKQQYTARKRAFRAHLRQGQGVEIHRERLHPEEDKQRGATEVVAEYGGERISWGEVREHLSTSNHALDLDRRLEALERYLDNELMVMKAEQAGLDRDPHYLKRLAEFSKTHLVNTHREKIMAGWQPSDAELREYYIRHRERIAFREHRRLRMVVLSTRETAEQVKASIERGQITLYEAAVKHSIQPGAKQTLGDFGWVERGSGFPDLDELAFSLEPGELGGPVQSPAGWHLLQVTDQRQSQHTQFADETTRRATRRLLLKERLDQYAVELRKTGYPVSVYEDNLNRLLRQEANWMAAKSKAMADNPQRAQQILDGMRSMVD